MVTLPPGVKVLHMSDPDFTEKLVDAIGLQPGEKLTIHTPQFERGDDIQPGAKPPCEFGELRGLSEARLQEIGLRKWSEPDENGNVLWLLPYTWYGSIPEGFMLTCIDGTAEPFQKGVTDDDYRFGCLAYGILKQKEK